MIQEFWYRWRQIPKDKENGRSPILDHIYNIYLTMARGRHIAMWMHNYLQQAIGNGLWLFDASCFTTSGCQCLSNLFTFVPQHILSLIAGTYMYRVFFKPIKVWFRTDRFTQYKTTTHAVWTITKMVKYYCVALRDTWGCLRRTSKPIRKYLLKAS